MNVLGIHHVTAITADIRRNLEYYTGTLGLRLVKKSVNQDDTSAYHLFYADAVASPGTDMTFFDWPMAGPNEVIGGGVSLTTFRVPRAGLDFWMARLRDADSSPVREADRITFADPEGQRLALQADDGLPGAGIPWPAVPTEFAIRGILGVDLVSLNYAATSAVLTELLGFKENEPGQFETPTTETIGRVTVRASEARRLAHPGAGGIHHVAFRAVGDAHLYDLKTKIEAAGLRTSGYVDRFYFHSLYFREPGGTLFEIATEGPGFTADEPMETLGSHLALPPFLEGQRAEIEANLKPIPDPAPVS